MYSKRQEEKCPGGIVVNAVAISAVAPAEVKEFFIPRPPETAVNAMDLETAPSARDQAEDSS
jgi:hypothetical protein